MNQFGNNFRITIFGESHGEAVGMVADGVEAGLKLNPSDFARDLRRRKYGDIASLSEATTRRKEADIPQFLSGLYKGRTTGAPLTIIFKNADIRSDDYARFREHPRPSHADFASDIKYHGFNDLRGGGHFSGRLTAPLVAAGVVARKMVQGRYPAIAVKGSVASIGGSTVRSGWKQLLQEALAAGDTLGGTVVCRAEGIPAGIGEPFFDSIESRLAHLAFSIPGVKGISFGDGAGCDALRGSEFNDAIVSADGATATNHNGGICGGLTNGNPLVFSLNIRPAASIGTVQRTLNLKSGTMEPLHIGGRHDCCIALRCPVIAEAIIWLLLADTL